MAASLGRLRGFVDLGEVGPLKVSIQELASLPEEEVLARARADARVGSHLAGREVRKTIYLPGRLLNLVVR